MAKRGKVVPFRKPPTQPRRVRRRPISIKRLLVPAVILGLVLVAVALGLVDERTPGTPAANSASGNQVVRVTWVDGDSGRLDGREFRLHGVDAPEGSPQRAQCARERELSSGAREAARGLTDGVSVRVSRSYGKDDYGREIVDLSAGGRDVADQLVAKAKLQRWNFDGGESKPDWCR